MDTAPQMQQQQQEQDGDGHQTTVRTTGTPRQAAAGSGGAEVDTLWRDMMRGGVKKGGSAAAGTRSGGAGKASSVGGSGGVRHIPGLGAIGGVASRAAETKGAESAATVSARGGATGVEESKAIAVRDTTVPADRYLMTADEFLTAIARDINCLDDADIGVRRRAIEHIHSKLFGADACVREDALQDIFSELTKPLSKRFADPVEKIRELAITTATTFYQHVADIGISLPYVFPAIMERLMCNFVYDFELKVFVRNVEDHMAHLRGRIVKPKDVYATAVVEPSEEIRLALAKCLAAVVDAAQRNGATEMLKPYLHETIVAANACCVDPFPDLKIFAFEFIVKLVALMPGVVKFYAPAFVKQISLSLDHRHKTVRLAALDALDACVQCPDVAKQRGAGTEAITELIAHRDENVVPVAAFYGQDTHINYFAKLVSDSNVMVRVRFSRMLGEWLLRLPDRVDHESRLLPYLLSGVGDDHPDVCKMALYYLDQIGIVYEREKHDEVIEKKQYGVDGSVNIDHSKPLPAPFTERPRLGTRLFVRHNCNRFFKVVLKELGSWVSATRVYASRLIVVLVVYMEEHITHDVHALLNCLYTTLDQPDVAKDAAIAATLCGRFVEPKITVKLMLPYLQGDAVVPASAKLSAVVRVLDLVLAEPKASTVLPFIGTLAHVFTLPHMLESTDQVLLLSILRVVNRLAHVLDGHVGGLAGAAFDATGRLADPQVAVTNLLRVALSLPHDGEFAELAADTIATLASATNTHQDVLIASRAAPLLADLPAGFPDRLWHVRTAAHLLVDNVLRLTPAASLAAMPSVVTHLLLSFLRNDLADRRTGALSWIVATLERIWSAEEPIAAFRNVQSSFAAEFFGAACWSESSDGTVLWAHLLSLSILGHSEDEEFTVGIWLDNDEVVGSIAPVLLPTLERLVGPELPTRERTHGVLAATALLSKLNVDTNAEIVHRLTAVLVASLDDSQPSVRLLAASGLQHGITALESSDEAVTNEGLRPLIETLLLKIHAVDGEELIDMLSGLLYQAASVVPATTASILSEESWQPVRGTGRYADSPHVRDLQEHCSLLQTLSGGVADPDN